MIATISAYIPFFDCFLLYSPLCGSVINQCTYEDGKRNVEGCPCSDKGLVTALCSLETNCRVLQSSPSVARGYVKGSPS